MISSGTSLSRQKEKNAANVWTHGLSPKDFLLEGTTPTKNKALLWQIVSGCIAVKKNLRARGIQGDIHFPRCEATEELINQRFKFGHSQGSHQIHIFSLPNQFSKIWIICT